MPRKESKTKTKQRIAIKPRLQEQTNEVVNSITHLIGAVLSIAALVLLVVFGAIYGTAWHVVGFSIFGSCLVLLYLSSTLYHFLSPGGKAKEVFLRIDHSMIFVLIAGTYTAVCLTILRGPLGWTLFGLIWACAVLGIVLKSVGYGLHSKMGIAMYVVVGWLVAIAIVPLFKVLPLMGMFWLVLGGVSYSIGALICSLDETVPRTRWFGMHELFHVFVLFGSFCHFWVMFHYVVYL